MPNIDMSSFDVDLYYQCLLRVPNEKDCTHLENLKESSPISRLRSQLEKEIHH